MSQSDTIDRNFLAKANTLGGHTYLLTDFDAAAIHNTTIKRLNKRYVVHPAQADHLTDLKFMFFSTLYLVVDGAVPLSRSLPVLKQTSAMQKKLQEMLSDLPAKIGEELKLLFHFAYADKDECTISESYERVNDLLLYWRDNVDLGCWYDALHGIRETGGCQSLLSLIT
eukprot:m.115722 g.115722  ORF g.115722 m.115722 type:complete len:169 (+) comp15501_c0_seq12:1074-1580(+)